MQLHASRWAVLAAAAALACAAQARDAAADDSAAPTPAPAGAPRSAPTGTNVTTIGNSNLLGENTRRAFVRLDTQRKGYLTRDDVGENAFLAAHFDSCDSNRDAQLSRSEVSACLRGREP